MVVSDPLRPNGTVLMEWSGGTGHADINNEVTDPDEDITTWIQADIAHGDDDDVCIVSFPNTIDDVDEVTNITVKTFGDKITLNPAVAINMGGWSEQLCTLGDVPFPAWATDSFDGNWSQEDLDGLQVRYRADIADKTGLNQIYICYVVVTYTQAAEEEGWPHKVLGMTPAKFNGMEITDGVKILGIG